MVRCDFHHHVSADPVDGSFVLHSAGELIDRAVAVGLQVLSITCHESVPYDGDVVDYAAQRGVLLMRGMEATVDGQHVLLLNFPEFPSGSCTIDDVRAAKTAESMVIAPHPFYPGEFTAAKVLSSHGALFDAVEFSGLYTPLTRVFNQHAAGYAKRVGLPVVGNSDTHFLWQMGRTYTEIDADPEPAAIRDALRNGRVRLRTRPLSWRHLARFVVTTHSTGFLVRSSLQYLTRIVRRTRVAAQTSTLIVRPHNDH